VSLNPSHIIPFKLERGTQPRTVLRITNISGQKVAFKVKTTQPSWYFVRPNQDILDANQSEDVAVLMVESENNQLLDLAASGAPKSDEDKSHRFLVQSKVISEAEFSRIKSTNPSQKIDELSKLWDGPNKDDKRNVKLKVEFIYPDQIPVAARAPSVASRIPSSVSEGVDNVRSRLARNTVEADSVTTSGNPDLILMELQNLRKKYDSVVEYTVHLTAERDSIVGQLESAQKELTNRDKRKKIDGVAAVRKDKETDAVIQGFSLFAVLATALICFLLGKYIA
jgi:hypothetical protein